jgi:hypothetical protein
VQNLNDAKFCRACGADIRLVPQALQGRLEEEKLATRPKEKKPRKPATVDEGFKNIFQGIGLLIIFLIGIYVFRGAFWLTVWFIIPALSSFGEGIGQLIRARQERQQLLSPPMSGGVDFQPAPLAPASGLRQLSSPDTAEMLHTPASVTEATTRHLDAPFESGAKDA